MTQSVDEMIAALEAFKRDGKIQYTWERATDRWIETNIPIWDFYHNEYRPVPKPIEVWVWILDGGYLPATEMYPSEESAKRSNIGKPGRAVLMREVIE